MLPRPLLQLTAADLDRKFRVVEAQQFLDQFASDRSHMIVNGEYASPAPVWPPLRGGLAGSAHNIQTFIDMEENRWVPASNHVSYIVYVLKIFYL